jgi:hypothetical protein
MLTLRDAGRVFRPLFRLSLAARGRVELLVSYQGCIPHRLAIHVYVSIRYQNYVRCVRHSNQLREPSG